MPESTNPLNPQKNKRLFENCSHTHLLCVRTLAGPVSPNCGDSGILGVLPVACCFQGVNRIHDESPFCGFRGFNPANSRLSPKPAGYRHKSDKKLQLTFDFFEQCAQSPTIPKGLRNFPYCAINSFFADLIKPALRRASARLVK